MVLPALSWTDGVVLAVAVLALAVPGVVVGLAAGLRGWRLAAVAPLLSMAVVGLGGPWSAAVGMSWSPATAALATVVLALLVLPLGLRRGLRRQDPVYRGPGSEASWRRPGHIAVVLCVLLAGTVGAVGVLVGLDRLDAVLSGWDAGFHANGIRWILETGDGGVDAMMRVNWYEPGDERFYPNAYHLLCAVIATVSPGLSVTSAMNAVTALTPAIGALGVAALVRRFGGGAVTAGFAAVFVVAAAQVTHILWYGPLLPYALGVALLAPGTVLAVDVATAPTWRVRLRDGALLALGATALFSLHPGVIITAVLFAAPAVLAALWGRRASPGPVLLALLALVGAGVATAVLSVPQILGSLQSAAGAEVDWPAVRSPAEALGELLLFHHSALHPQVWLAIPLALGLLCASRLGALRWLVPSAAIFAMLYVAAASYDTDWSLAITRPWWNDRYRLVAVATVALCVVAAFGVAQVHRKITSALVARLEARRHVAVSGAVGAALLAALVVLSNGLYLGRLEEGVRNSVGNGSIVTIPTVSASEKRGYEFLARLVPPDQRVMNDRRDGSLWMYALHGVHPVFGHYDATDVSADQLLLAARFNAYDTDPEVRAAAQRLRVGWVVVGTGFVTQDAVREPGLEGLDEVGSLERVYDEDDVTVYRLVPLPLPAPAVGP